MNIKIRWTNDLCLWWLLLLYLLELHLRFLFPLNGDLPFVLLMGWCWWVGVIVSMCVVSFVCYVFCGFRLKVFGYLNSLNTFFLNWIPNSHRAKLFVSTGSHSFRSVHVTTIYLHNWPNPLHCRLQCTGCELWQGCEHSVIRLRLQLSFVKE